MADAKKADQDNQEQNNEPGDIETQNTSENTDKGTDKAPSSSSQNNPPQKTNSKDSGSSEDRDDFVKIKADDYKALRNSISALTKDHNSLKDKLAVREKLDNTDLPLQVKEILTKRVDTLTPDNFDIQAEIITEAFNTGAEARKASEVESINAKPSRAVPKDVTDQLDAADSLEALRKSIEGYQ